jgi:putative membrane protein insertion efficiency factor
MSASAAPARPAIFRHSPLGWAMIGALRCYRAAISPALPPSCRYEPSCSAYALGAVTRFGGARGGYLAVRRLLRCHPWHRGGEDPVPETFTLRYRRTERQLDPVQLQTAGQPQVVAVLADQGTSASRTPLPSGA